MMQRRSGKGSAHISPPAHARGDGSDKDSEKVSRLNQRTLGLTNRIWIILMLISFIVIFTRLILPPDQSSHHRDSPYASSNLHPKNYLNNTAEEPYPFAFCPVFGPGDELGAKYGPQLLAKTRLHLGSGARVQRVINKALAGLPVTISILGGSVSACHGAGDDPISPKCYPAKFFEWWNRVFPHPATELTNGAMRRTNSAYFSFCNSHHLPDVTDLVILELDADDPNDPLWLDHFELLVRSILTRPDTPAVVILGHFSPQIVSQYGYNGPEAQHSVVAQFYDIPHISAKQALYSQWVVDPESIMSYYADPVLANSEGHTLMADIMIAYMQTQICSAWQSVLGRNFEVISPLTGSGQDPKQPTDARGLFGGVGMRHEELEGKDGFSQGDNLADSPALQALRVPAARIRSKPEQSLEEMKPFCASANDLINPLPPSLFYGSGWHVNHPSAGVSSLSSQSHFWYSTFPTSKLRVPIQVSAGDIGVYYMREPKSTVDEAGSAVECWVDDNYAGSMLIANAADVSEPVPTLVMIDHGVAKGSHFVECKLMGEEGRPVPRFRLLGIFSA